MFCNLTSCLNNYDKNQVGFCHNTCKCRNVKYSMNVTRSIAELIKLRGHVQNLVSLHYYSEKTKLRKQWNRGSLCGPNPTRGSLYVKYLPTII